jgi:uncharacterized protein (DUF2252 family)
MHKTVNARNCPQPNARLAIVSVECNRKMAFSAHAYVRGSTKRFYEGLKSSNRAALPEGPTAWICGDCQVGNLGPVASADGAVAIQIRDFDQTITPVYDATARSVCLRCENRLSDHPATG